MQIKRESFQTGHGLFLIGQQFGVVLLADLPLAFDDGFQWDT